MNDGAALLDRIRELVVKYVVLPGPAYLDAIALWILHAHAISAADTTPRLVFKSAQKESGKTRALEVLEMLVPAPLFTVNATVAAIFRLLDAESATILADEVDAIFGPTAAKEHEDLRALLNAGYRRGATVARVVGEGSKMQTKRFPVFAATALATIGNLPDTIESRAVVVPMRRRAPDESVASFRRRKVSEETLDVREWSADWAGRHLDVLAAAEPEMPQGVTDRAADCWEALFAIADLAGADWPQRARAAAQTIVAGRVADDQSLGVRLLADIKAMFDGHDRMPSAGLVNRLNAIEESPWGGWHCGKGLDPRGLAQRLKPFGIEPKNIKLPDGSVPKGYHRSQFFDGWLRYLRYRDSAAPAGSATRATSATQIRIPVAAVAAVAHPGGEGASTPNGHSSGVKLAPNGYGHADLCPACESADIVQRPDGTWVCMSCVAAAGTGR